jgi:hypothetical protein
VTTQSSLRLSPKQERAWALERQFARAGGIAAVARALVGLHASRHLGPYVAGRARLPHLAPSELRTRPDEGGLVVLRCMRSTLHAMPSDTAQVAHEATFHRRMQRSTSELRRVNLGPRRSQRLRNVALDELAEGALGNIWLSRLMAREPRLTRMQCAAVIRDLWHRNEVRAFDGSDSMHRAARFFEPGIGASGAGSVSSESGARCALAERYLATYGPASARDISWWTGWGHQITSNVLSKLGGRLMPVRVDGLVGQLFIRAADEGSAREAVDGLLHQDIKVLAYEDPSMKAYYATRSRYMDVCDARRVFWHAGEARATVWVGGRVAATWRWSRVTGVLWEAVRPLASTEAARIGSELEATDRFLSQEIWSPVHAKSRSVPPPRLASGALYPRDAGARDGTSRDRCPEPNISERNGDPTQPPELGSRFLPGACP